MVWWLALGLAMAQSFPIPRNLPSDLEVALDFNVFIPPKGPTAGGGSIRVGIPFELTKTKPFWLAVPELQLAYVGGNFQAESFGGLLNFGIGGRIQGMVWHGRDFNKGKKKKKNRIKGRKRFESTADVGPYLHLMTSTLNGSPPQNFAVDLGVTADYRAKWFVGGAHAGWLQSIVSEGTEHGAATVGMHFGARF